MAENEGVGRIVPVMLRRDCKYYLRYGSRDYCRFVWTVNIGAPPQDLVIGGCDYTGRCPNYYPLDYKRKTLPPLEQDVLASDEAAALKPATLEWDDVEEETKNELPPKEG